MHKLCTSKQIPIEHFLNMLNHKPVKSSGDDLWYKSPLFYEDKMPLFKVNKILLWLWISEGVPVTVENWTSYINDETFLIKALMIAIECLRSIEFMQAWADIDYGVKMY